MLRKFKSDCEIAKHSWTGVGNSQPTDCYRARRLSDKAVYVISTVYFAIMLHETILNTTANFEHQWPIIYTLPVFFSIVIKHSQECKLYIFQHLISWSCTNKNCAASIKQFNTPEWQSKENIV